MNTATRMIALVKREYIENRTGFFWLPAILLSIVIGLSILSVMGFGEIRTDEISVKNLGEGLAMLKAREPEQISAAITVLYWVSTFPAWTVFPFVVFFSLLGSLYEERRDRSILFMKSMPVADWEEVAAKLISSVFIAPLSFLALVIVAQLAIALLLSIVTLFQGGPALELWPLGTMIQSWIAWYPDYIVYALWALPIFAWLLLVSSFSQKVPFMFAIVPPAVLIALEAIFFETTRIGEWIGTHLGGWMSELNIFNHIDIDGPKDIVMLGTRTEFLQSMGKSFQSGSFWFGLVLAAAFFYGAMEIRRRNI